MTPYDIWLYFLQTFLNTIKFFKDHPTVPGLIILIMRQNSIRKVINSRLPKQFRDTVDADILEIKDDLKLIKKHLGVIGEWQSNGQVNGLKRHPLSFSKLFVYLHKVIPQGNQLRRKKKMIQFLKSNISKKLLTIIIGVAVTALNNKFNLQVSENDIYIMFAGIIAYIVGQSHVDGKKAIANSVSAISKGIQASVPNIEPMPTTYQEVFPKVKEVHEGLQKIFQDIQKNDGSQAFRDASSTYLALHDIFQSLKPPVSVPEVVEQVPA